MGFGLTPKVFRFLFQYRRSIPRPAFESHNRRMDPNTLSELHEEIDDLQALLRNRELQLTWARQQNQQLRVKLNRYEATMGWEEAA